MLGKASFLTKLFIQNLAVVDNNSNDNGRSFNFFWHIKNEEWICKSGTPCMFTS